MLLTLLAAMCLGCCLSETIVDLTHPLSPSTLYWPGVPGFNRTRVFAERNQNNVWMEVGVFTSGEHGGTHIDAPRHFDPKGYDLKDLPLELTIAEGVVIDVRQEVVNNSDYSLTLQKIEEWEREHGTIPERAAVLVNTGWSTRWPNPSRFFNSNKTDDPSTFHFPTVSLTAAQWLVTQRSMQILAVDVPAPDGPRDSNFPVHSLLLPRNILILENVRIPADLPPRDFRLHASPVRIQDGTGTQTRVYAILYDKNGSVSGYQTSMLAVVLFVLCVQLGFV